MVRGGHGVSIKGSEMMQILMRRLGYHDHDHDDGDNHENLEDDYDDFDDQDNDDEDFDYVWSVGDTGC